VPRDGLRRAAWNEAPVGNGPFRFVAHEPNRRWVFAATCSEPISATGSAGHFPAGPSISQWIRFTRNFCGFR